MSTACHQLGRRLPMPAAWPARSSRTAHQWAVVSAALSPVLLTGGYLVAGALQPASYHPVRTAISAMAGLARNRARPPLVTASPAGRRTIHRNRS
jgi:hypothetical protein